MTEKTMIATFNLPVELMTHIKDIAAHRKISDQELVAAYLKECADRDLQKVKWCDFVSQTKDLLHQHKVPAEAIDEIIDKFSY